MTIFFCFFCCVDLAQFANCAKFVFFGAKKVVYLRNKCKKIPPSCIVTWRVPSLVLLYRVWHHLHCIAALNVALICSLRNRMSAYSRVTAFRASPLVSLSSGWSIMPITWLTASPSSMSSIVAKISLASRTGICIVSSCDLL